MLNRLLAAIVLTLAALPAAGQRFGEFELLEPEKAFRISARALDERNVEVEFKIAHGYYMYRDRFSFATESGTPLAEVQIPRGKIKEDQFFGKTETFRDLVRIRVPISPETAQKGVVNLKVTSQGCSDKGVCYTPLEQLVSVSLPSMDGGVGKPSRLRSGLEIPWLLLAASLAGGLALGWASAGAPLARDATRHIARPAVAVWGLALGGASFAWLGSAVAGRVENPWIAAPFALVFVAFAALWMHWSMRPGEFNRPLRAARDVSLLAAALLLSFHAGDVWLGAAATLGLGLAAGLFPKARTEARHEPALQLVALAMLASAAWVAAPILPDLARMLVWSACLIVGGTLLRAVDPLPEGAPAAMRLLKAAGVVALVWGIAVLIGAASGARDPLRPFEGFSGAGKRAAEPAPVRFERVATLAELEARIASAGRPVMLDFYADWCVSCKEMERFTFSDPQVRSRMERMLLLQVDVTRNTPEDQAMLRRFKLFGPPGIIFFDASGRELQNLRVVGFQPAERFARVLERALEPSQKGGSS
jgi:thiol:disulfide interchange protein DsbD